MWKDHYKEFESSKQHSIWILIKNKVDVPGKHKTLKQIKTKIRNLKDVYIACKDNNKKTGSLLLVAHIFKTDEILGTRDVVNFAHARVMRKKWAKHRHSR